MFGMMQSQSVCPTCGGEGKVIKNKCKQCGGTGIVTGDEVVEVKIPAGVADGMVLNVPGKGDAAIHNGVPGDIQVFIEVEPDKDFIRQDNDLIYNLLIDVPTATLGGSVEIPTIDGKVKVKIEPGTQPGKVLRLRGKGLPALKGYGYGVGDLIVNVSVYIPETLSRDEKLALERFGQSENFRPNQSIKDKIFNRFKQMFE
jgi:molecular chaperone DnaJ